MQTQFIVYKESGIHLNVYGSGPKWLFCFHGFGQDGSSFKTLEKALGNDFTMLAIDFPFHGKTEWKQGLLMTPEDLLGIMAIIIHEHAALEQKPFKFSILAYSLGGRISLHLLQMIPNQVEKILLIAPDGLKVNFWYWLGTQTRPGNKLFAYTMKKPQWFFWVLNNSHKAGLLNKSIIKFVHRYVDDDAVRALLYKRWTTLRLFRPSLKAVKHIIIEKGIPVRLLYGSYDRIILSKRSDILKKNNEQVSVTIVDGGHELLKEKFAPVIASLLSE